MKKGIVFFASMICCLPLMVQAAEPDPNKNLVGESTVFVKTTDFDGVYVNEEITEEEFDKAMIDNNAGISPVAYVETSYKRLDMYVYDEGGIYEADMFLKWKGVPKARSYDVFAMRGQGMALVANSESGLQTYYKGSNSYKIDYPYNCANILINGTTGYGFSMNLVNGSDITGYELYNSAFFKKSITGTAKIFGTYQHATRDVTLAQSKSYSINANGLGGVIFFNDGTLESYYDDMNGVYVSIN